MPSTVDFSKFDARVDVLRKTMPRAVELALNDILSQTLTNIIDKTPRDTNRMVGGFVQAGNEAGLGPFRAPPIRSSKYLPGNQKALQRQVTKIAGFRNFLLNHGAQGTPSFRKIEKDLDRARKELEALTGTSILIINKGRDVAYTVRSKIYGGQGLRAEMPAGGLRVTISNREPHAIIRERVGRMVATELNLAKSSGVRRGKRIIMSQFEKAGVTKSR